MCVFYVFGMCVSLCVYYYYVCFVTVCLVFLSDCVDVLSLCLFVCIVHLWVFICVYVQSANCICMFTVLRSNGEKCTV